MTNQELFCPNSFVGYLTLIKNGIYSRSHLGVLCQHQVLQALHPQEVHPLKPDGYSSKAQI